MIFKECEICGKSFESSRNKRTCSDRCSNELARLKRRRYYENHKEEQMERCRKWREKNPEYYKEYQHKYAVERWNKCKHDKTEDTWRSKYLKSDRLTRLSMMELALHEHNIASYNYGYLSFIYDTEEYKKLEEKVFEAKEKLCV